MRRGGRAPAVTLPEVSGTTEILHRYRTLKVPEVGFQLFDAITHLGLPILPVTERAMAEARRLLEEYPGLSTRDCVHIGVMGAHEIEEVLSYDRGFSDISWIKRLEA